MSHSTPRRPAPGLAGPLATALLPTLVAAACASAPTPVELEQGPLYREISVLEDSRETGGDRLLAFMRHPDRDLRVRAAIALGRLPLREHGAGVTDALLGGLGDWNGRVRAEAAFALGLRGDPAAGDALVERAVHSERRDESALVRARCVEACSKLDRPDLRLPLLAALRDADPAVRAEAAQGAHRFAADEPDAAEVDRLLLDQLEWEGERAVISMALFSLQRRRAASARPAFLRYAASRNALERIWAVRGLAALGPTDPTDASEATLKALEIATRDPDWRVAYEATAGLGDYELGVASATLLGATGHRRPHVRRAAWESLATRLARVEDPALVERATAWRVPFDERDARQDTSPSVRAAFGRALVHYQHQTGSADLSRGVVEARLAAGHTSVEEWVAYATALGEIGPRDPAVGGVLELLAAQPDVRVAGAALGAMGSLRDADARRVLHAGLEHPDNGLRLAAVLALAEEPGPEDVEPLGRAYDVSHGDIGPEVRFNVLRALAAIGTDRARVLLLEGLNDSDPFVRQVAREELTARWPEAHLDQAALARPLVSRIDVPRPGQDHPVYRRNPRVRVLTTKGALTFELFPREAPIHVHNFLTLAERGHYEGTLFHRVVPDFVIQGGDYRGDGNGGTTWRGDDALRHEIRPRKYMRGSLGMPRNENPDSGGSQIFVTHRPTPHLDGRYTIFGELRDGFDVLDAIDVGDRIAEVKRLGRRR